MAELVCTDGNIAVQDLVDGVNSKVSKAGDTMVGNLILPGGATLATEALQSQEIDSKIATAINAVASGIELSANSEEIVQTDGSWVKNQLSAWVVFDGTTTPPTIEDSYNVSSVSRNATGQFTVTFIDSMLNTDYIVTGGSDISNVTTHVTSLAVKEDTMYLGAVTVRLIASGSDAINRGKTFVNIFGGKV